MNHLTGLYEVGGESEKNTPCLACRPKLILEVVNTRGFRRLVAVSMGCLESEAALASSLVCMHVLVPFCFLP